ncbi:glycosyltransferase family 2 protein [Polynucleobacter sp. AP-Sving-400A-A2]|nr:glycosyltransferase family 2 protein [Polynucleobacter sp. AP-Sving-400A-A2]
MAILLCTYNGARFLAEQLDSLESQTHRNWVVIASDDGSTDQTLEILQQYQAKWPVGKLTIRSGPQKGFCQNFLSLACDPEIKTDYYAFCDQDDVWLPEKLEVALENIVSNQSDDVAYLYCGRTNYVTENLEPCGMSPLFVFPPSFRNALVQSIAGGNTMVFNIATKNLIEKVGVVDVPSHDWWVYQLISASNGIIYYDPAPQLLYRQHKNTLVGGNTSIASRLQRTWLVLTGRFKEWNQKNVSALITCESIIAPQNLDVLYFFKKMREAKLKDRFRLIEVCGLYRQTKKDTLNLYLATLINKI